MSKEEPVLEKTIEGIIPAVTDAEYVCELEISKIFPNVFCPRSTEFSYDCRVVWHTSGEHFFIATRGHGLLQLFHSLGTA